MHYKAFISYSHVDASWAAWLHRSLESYRTPKRLVGSEGLYGDIPKRLTPVFRDREELSSASSLSQHIEEALQESETLLVICSPAAAASNWVNEEIRYFRSLGRAERVYCIVVDGDPGSSLPGEACFPPALFENGDSEPLAADVRKWADGKQLARLKIISGLLGVRLDQLRQRELQRRRRLQAISAISIAALLTLIVFTVQSRLAEQEAREARAAQQASAESMLAQFLEQSRRLSDMADLETRKAFGEVLAAYLADLDPTALTPESRRQLGVALANRGIILREEEHLDEALDVFLKAHETLRQLVDEYPEDREALFELSQLEYWVGQVHLDHGRMEDAQKYFQAYADAAETLYSIDPSNADWTMEVAYAQSNLGNLERRRTTSDPERMIAYYQAALDFNVEAARLDRSYEAELTDSHADVSDAWLRVCDLEKAEHHRLQNVELAAAHYGSNPANNRLKLDYAYSLSGLSWVQQQQGRIEIATKHVNQSRDLLTQLMEEDPSNLNRRWHQLIKTAHLADLLWLGGDRERGWQLSVATKPTMEALVLDEEDVRIYYASEYGEFLRKYAERAFQRGETVLGDQLAEASVRWLDDVSAGHPDNRKVANQLTLSLILLRSRSGTFSRSLEETEQVNPRACDELDIAARLAASNGHTHDARRHTDSLLQQSYREPSFMQFCRQQNLCAGDPSVD